MKRALAVLVLLGTVAWVAPRTQRPQVFPHARHEGLFPTCAGCHQGIPTGDSATFFPDSSVCVACHNGTVQVRIQWTKPEAAPTNLRFTHQDHPMRPEGSTAGVTCLTCHRQPGATGRMSVGPADPDACLACHRADSHLAQGRDCLKCHVPVTEAKGLSAAAVKNFPKPAWHGDSTFLTSHAPTVDEATRSCSVCHARESCERCHLNAAAVKPIASLGRDARVARSVAGEAPTYPIPRSHRSAAWSTSHGSVARGGVGECANCHVQANCRLCHQTGNDELFNRLPSRPSGDPRGVHMSATAAQVHPAGWTTHHGAEAADGGATCASCHAQDFCVRCHAGQTTPSFHPPNFLQMHGPDAYGPDVECVSCHNTEAFCRTCHAGVGLASGSRLTVAFHTANPNWLVGHGQAARQGLQGCVTCHSESDCMQCHSAVGGWGINPHGPDFDPSRLRSVAPFSCLPCHTTGIPGGAP
jgi:hypothetical protein